MDARTLTCFFIAFGSGLIQVVHTTKSKILLFPWYMALVSIKMQAGYTVSRTLGKPLVKSFFLYPTTVHILLDMIYNKKYTSMRLDFYT